jgi:hypothetical protein
MFTGEPVAPATRVSDAGDTVNEKSGGGGAVVTVSMTVAEWLRIPDVPVKVSVALPAAAVKAAVRVTFCAVPGVNVSDAGFAVTPAGNPVIETATVPVKPFNAVARMFTGEPVAPATRVSDAGDTVNEKSAAGTGTMTWVPHDARARHKDKPHRCAIFTTSGLRGHFDEIAMAFVGEGRTGRRESDFKF